MIADSTSASSGEITSSRSVSVLDGVICSSGISSPVPGSRYWIRLWWDSSVSSSMRMPVWRSTSTIAQVQNAAVFVEGRGRGGAAGVGVFGPDPAGGLGLHHRPAQRRAGRGEQLAGLGALGRGEQFGGAVAFGGHPGDQGGQHRQPFAGALVHPGLAVGAVLLVRDVAGADRAAHRPWRPTGPGRRRPTRRCRGRTPAPRTARCARPAAARSAGPARRPGRSVGAGAGHHPLLPGRGDLAGQLAASRCRDGGPPGRPRTACRAGRRSAAARRSPPTGWRSRR